MTDSSAARAPTRCGTAGKDACQSIAGEKGPDAARDTGDALLNDGRRIEQCDSTAASTTRRPEPQRVRDRDLADRARAALIWNQSLPREAIAVSVENGWITLSGVVPWHYQRQDAINCVRGLAGVIGIRDCITLRVHSPRLDGGREAPGK